MKIIRPYARMITGFMNENYDPGIAFQSSDGIRLLKHIEWCARISHRSEDAVTGDSYKRIIQDVVIKHGDWSVVEHATVSVDMVVDRGITHEWVRHRLNAFTQESTRFVNYEKKMPPSFIYPIPGVECKRCLSGNEVVYRQDSKAWKHYAPDMVWEDCVYHPQWLYAIDYAEDQYKTLMADPRKDASGAGWRPQEARSVFPNALASRIITTSNLRNWRHMLIMRTSAQAHPQMRQVMIPLLKEFQEKIPLLFDDIIPEQQQSEALKRAR